MKSRVNKPVIYLFALFCVLLMTTGHLPAQSEPRAPSDVSSYEQPDPHVVHQQLQDILAQKRYQPKKSFVQHLRDFFFGFEGKAPRISSEVGWFLFGLLMVWCCVTLLAILAHFIWSIVMMSRRGTVHRRNADPDGPEAADRTEEDLRALVRQMAEAGDYHRAVKYLMLATLKQLASKGVLQFHSSKTNGDYLRDFGPEYQEYAGFKACVSVFEKCVYGRMITPQAAYHQMTALASAFEEIE